MLGEGGGYLVIKLGKEGVGGIRFTEGITLVDEGGGVWREVRSVVFEETGRNGVFGSCGEDMTEGFFP